MAIGVRLGTVATEIDVTEDDKTYYYQRAAAQLELAERTDNPAAVAAHYRIAQTYLNRYGEELIAEARAIGTGLRAVAGNDADDRLSA